jgi:8-oxo-dGTP pyrophosphatase MutT (NUDIX family)
MVSGAAVSLGGHLPGPARDVLAGRRKPVPPRDAATVMLLRAGRGGPEVYMLRRTPTMSFAPGAQVFPGGAVDPRDADAEIAWAGPDAAAWAALLHSTPELAAALVCAAVRETFEETGVLLAGTGPGSVVTGTLGAGWEHDRRSLLDRSVSLAQLLARRGLVLRSDLLRPWSRWITPVIEQRRYDTRFFVAALPAGQRTRDVGGEAEAVAWVRPADALAAGRRGDIVLWPPTAVSLAEIAACRSVAEVLASQRKIVPLLPEVELKDGMPWLIVPGIEEYPL